MPVKAFSSPFSTWWKFPVSNQFFLQTAVNAVREYRGEEALDRFDFADFIEDKIEPAEYAAGSADACGERRVLRR